MEIRKDQDITPMDFAQCHDGEGVLKCKSLLDGFNSQKFWYMHSDFMAAGVSIGEHLHEGNEEIYYLSSGKGILYFDGKEFEMNPGDISLCTPGHSHGFKALEDSVLIVVA